MSGEIEDPKGVEGAVPAADDAVDPAADDAVDPVGDDATPTTGVASVDAAAQRLTELAHAPVEAHVGIYEDIHHRLQEGLADLDDQ